MGKFLDRLKRDFAWENDEYDVPEEAPIHPEISAEFPGVLMDGDDEERDLGLDDREETDEEIVQRVSQTTGVQAHDAGLTGVRDAMSTDNDPTIIVVQQNHVNEGVHNDKDDNGDDPEGNKNDDSDSIDTTPGNPLLEHNVR